MAHLVAFKSLAEPQTIQASSHTTRATAAAAAAAAATIATTSDISSNNNNQEQSYHIGAPNNDLWRHNGVTQAQAQQQVQLCESEQRDQAAATGDKEKEEAREEHEDQFDDDWQVYGPRARSASISVLGGQRNGRRSLDESVSQHFEIRWSGIQLRAPTKRSAANSSWLSCWRRQAPVSLTTSNNNKDATATFDTPNTQESPAQGAEKIILNNLSGSVRSGELTAILGPSGVGKTSLLNALTGRNTLPGSGRVHVLGGAARKRIAVCTIGQTDALPDQLTVGEDLAFASRLKSERDREPSDAEHARNVARVVRLMHLHKCVHTRCSKLSGGERRRVSIARELLSSPDLMILDEPTSGLDSSTCWKIIRALRDLVTHNTQQQVRQQADGQTGEDTSNGNEADAGQLPMAIIVTIHQPQREVLELFHRAYVMAHGGRAIYEGPPQQMMPTLLVHGRLAERKQRARHEQRAGAATTPTFNENAAIVAIEVASGEYGIEAIDELAAYHEATHLFQETQARMLQTGGWPQWWAHQQQQRQLTHSGAGASSSVPSSPAWAHAHTRAHQQLMSMGSISQRTTPLVPRATLSNSGNNKNNNQSNSNNASKPRGHNQASVSGTGSPLLAHLMLARTGHPVHAESLTQSKQIHAAIEAKDVELSTVAPGADSSLFYGQPVPESQFGVKVDKRLRRSLVHRHHFWRHTWCLMRRSWLLYLRNTFLMCIRVLGFLLVGQGTVSIFGPALDGHAHLCPSLERSHIDDVGAYVRQTAEQLDERLIGQYEQARSQHLFFFHVVLCISMVTSALTGLVFPQQMRQFLREHKNGWYSLGSFLVSNTLAELPVDLLGPTLTIVVAYPLCNQPMADSVHLWLNWRFYGYLFVSSMACLICKSQAQMVGACLMDSIENSVFASCVMVTPPALLSGIAVRIADMYTVVQWAASLSFLRYAFESLQVLRYGFGLCAHACDPSLVDIYPARASVEAVPPHLKRLASSLLHDSLSNHTTLPNITTTTTTGAPDNNMDLFDSIVGLLSQANNLFAPDGHLLSSCTTTRSLYLLKYNLQDSLLAPWLAILVLMWLVSRLITYFTLKLVMHLRRRD